MQNVISRNAIISDEIRHILTFKVNFVCLSIAPCPSAGNLTILA